MPSVSEVGSRGRFLSRLVTQRGEQPDEAGATLPRRKRAGLGAAEGRDSQTISATRGQMPDRDRDSLGDVRLAPLGRPELHRDRRVEHEPGHEDALGEIDADVRLVRPCGDVPVDPPHVVPRLVRAHHRELRARAEEVRAEVAREQPLHAAGDRDVERAQEPFRHRAGPGAGRRRAREERARGARPHATLARPRSSCGAGTAARTWSSSVSGLTSSASAWYESTRRWRRASRARA